MIAKVYGVLFHIRKCSKTEGAHGCVISVNILKTIKWYTFKWVNCTVSKLYLKAYFEKKQNFGLFLRNGDTLVCCCCWLLLFELEEFLEIIQCKLFTLWVLATFFAHSLSHLGGLLTKNGIFPCDKVILTTDMSFCSPQQHQVSGEPSEPSLPSFKEVT